MRHQMVNVGDAAGDGIVDGYHGELRLAFRDGGEGVLEDAAGERLMVGEGLLAGDVRVGSQFTLEGYCFRLGGQVCSPSRRIVMQEAAEYWHRAELVNSRPVKGLRGAANCSPSSLHIAPSCANR